MTKSTPRQLAFAFADSPQGNVDGASSDDSGTAPPSPQEANDSQRQESTRPEASVIDTSRLLERVASRINLELALDRVVSNRGAPGVDQQTVKQVDEKRDVLLPLLSQALLRETYVPGDIRRVWIPKASGGQRGLGIPNVVDRWVQMAVLQVLEPIFEPTFHESSHGFRPGRGAQTAIADCKQHVADGYEWVVDIDLEKFFDQVNHQRLLGRMSQRVQDQRLLRIVKLMLKAKVVMPDGTKVSTETGTPQGGPLSPLLSNIVLSELDDELARRKLRFVRYADDCQIYIGSERAGHRVLSSIRKFIGRRLRLKVNEAKSAVARSETRHFLGFRVGMHASGRATVELSERSEMRVKTRIKELLPRRWGDRLRKCSARLIEYLRGWMGHFRLCTEDVLNVLVYLDGHIRRRLRAIIVQQKKRPAHLYRHLRSLGVAARLARYAAFGARSAWVRSCTSAMHRAYPNIWFRERLGLVPLVELWYQSNGLPVPPKPPTWTRRKA